MTNTDTVKKRRRGFPMAIAGAVVGLGAAYLMVRWQRKSMPWTEVDREEDDFSIYEVSGDTTREWPVGSGSAAAARDYAGDPDDTGSALWGDMPAPVGLVAAVPAQAVDETAPEAAAAEGDSVTDGMTDSEGDAPAGRGRRKKLEEIEGIGPVHAKTLAEAGLVTVDDLLRAGADPKGREGLVEATGISKNLIMRWVNQADLFRIKGVGEQYADLLEAAGVDTVPELAQRRADNLTKKMAEVNEQKSLVRRIPTEAQVTAWIESAKGLPRVVSY